MTDTKQTEKYEIEHVRILMGWGDSDKGERAGFILQWQAKGIGFGCLTFRQKDDSTMECETECMSPEFVEAVLKKFRESLKLEHR